MPSVPRCYLSRPLPERFARDYLADDSVRRTQRRILSPPRDILTRPNFTPEGRERYEEYIEFLAEKFTNHENV
jgi:hypothetical protein